MKKITIFSNSGKEIFSYRCENNSIKITVEKAVENEFSLCNADLSSADLSGADLSYTDLSYTNLHYANFCNSNLSGADLRNANLYRADLRNANLRGADLRESNLRETDFRNANLSHTKNNIHSIYNPCVLANNEIQINYITKTVEEWDKWFASDEEFQTPRGTPEFKRIEAHYRAIKTYVEFLNKK